MNNIKLTAVYFIVFMTVRIIPACNVLATGTQDGGGCNCGCGYSDCTCGNCNTYVSCDGANDGCGGYDNNCGGLAGLRGLGGIGRIFG